MQAENIMSDEYGETSHVPTGKESGVVTETNIVQDDTTNPIEKNDALPAQSKKQEHHGASSSNGYDVPSRRLSILIEGRDYLKYRETFERLLFSEKMTPAQKDARILKLAMVCLTERMDAISAATGEPFVKAEILAG